MHTKYCMQRCTAFSWDFLQQSFNHDNISVYVDKLFVTFLNFNHRFYREILFFLYNSYAGITEFISSVTNSKIKIIHTLFKATVEHLLSWCSEYGRYLKSSESSWYICCILSKTWNNSSGVHQNIEKLNAQISYSSFQQHSSQSQHPTQWQRTAKELKVWRCHLFHFLHLPLGVDISELFHTCLGE